jgi:hypothetical protein
MIVCALSFSRMEHMAPHDLALLFWQLALGFSLAATTGLRAFLPLFAAAAAARLGQVTLGPSFAWMGSDPALIVFGSAVVIEVLGDKVPALDHLLDVCGVFVKPAAATLLAASMFTSMDPVMASALGLVTGGAVAGGVHVVKAKVRLASSVFTLGTGNPVLSLAEDVLSVMGVVLAILLPVVAAFVVLSLLALVGFFVVRRFTRTPVPPTAVRVMA